MTAWGAPVSVAAALVAPAAAFVLLWQVRTRLSDVFAAAKTTAVTVPEDLNGQAIKFVVATAAVLVVGLLAIGRAEALSAAARIALVGCVGVMFLHAAVFAPDVWIREVTEPFGSYYGLFTIVEVVLFAAALIAELYRAIADFDFDASPDIEAPDDE
ncbi:hypothetical protein [Tsukamurella sp. 1534]|uniref:hypothetical protein n=1 Tax=Tsukamurella sp. 1534 TaxID=1151061 RepID=UPI0011D1D613|nr:hypothetical protein [Tsukamurella sp. 1534]